MAAKSRKSISTTTALDAALLTEFWREIIKGKFTTADERGALKEIYVPLDVRLKASELLAKYIVPSQPAQEDDALVTATPEILRVAEMLTNSNQYTDADLRAALTTIPKDS